jgi:hypothetical protein
MTTDKCRDEFEAWIARECGDLSTFGSGKNIHYCNSAVNNAWTGYQEAARRAASDAGVTQQAREDALEEAAQLCESISDRYGDDEGGKWPELKTDAQTGARDCESAIRALASTAKEG